MNIYLYTTNEPENKIDKNLGTPTILNCKPYNINSILTPEIILNYSDMITSNYCYIPNLNRYYFIRDIRIDTGGRMILSLAVDVLKTYAEQIKQTPVNVVRWSGGTTFTNDSKYPLDSNRVFIQSETLNAPFTFTGNKYVIGVI